MDELADFGCGDGVQAVIGASQTHPITVADQDAMVRLRAASAANKGSLRGVAARPAFEAYTRGVAAPEGVTFRPDEIGGVQGWWCEPADVLPDVAILHAHGGWFSWGSAEGFRHIVGHIARSARAKAFVPEYRLAPEHRFPAACQDVEACFHGLADRVRRIALTGDSAGGNLALGLLGRLAALRRLDKIVGALVLSPVTDLVMAGASWISRAEADPFFVREQVAELVQAYLGDQDASHPMASPLYGDLEGLPPIRVHVGGDEVLLDDAVRYVEHAIAASVDAKAHIWEGMPHGFADNVGQFEAGADALSAIGDFLRERFDAATVS